MLHKNKTLINKGFMGSDIVIKAKFCIEICKKIRAGKRYLFPKPTLISKHIILVFCQEFYSYDIILKSDLPILPSYFISTESFNLSILPEIVKP